MDGGNFENNALAMLSWGASRNGEWRCAASYAHGTRLGGNLVWKYIDWEYRGAGGLERVASFYRYRFKIRRQAESVYEMSCVWDGYA